MKKIFVALTILIILLFFVIYPNEAINASKAGIMLWFEKLFPILFPCIIVSNTLLASNIIYKQGDLSLFICISGLLCGFPIGAKLSSDFNKAGLLSAKRAQILCNYSNQLSLAYINAVVVEQCIGIPQIKKKFLLALYLPPILILIIKLVINKNNPVQKKSASRFQINMQIIDAGIISGFETLIKLCGYIVLFSLYIKILNKFMCDSIIKCLIIGMIENINGIIYLSNTINSTQIKCLVAIIIVSFGGLSCIFQTGSIIKDSEISLKKYVISKIETTACAFILAIVLFCF